jgi:predicted nucleic acid-binding protein
MRRFTNSRDLSPGLSRSASRRVASVALDADVRIAFLDPGDAQHQRAVGELRRRLADAEQLIVGVSVYAEVMIRPLQQGTDAKVDEFLDATGTLVLAVNRSLARRAAQLHARHRSLRLGDALSLATALEHGAQLITFNHRLRPVAAREQASSRNRAEAQR